MAKESPETKKVRIIAENGTHPINAVVTLPAADAAVAVAAGWADDSAEGVAYAETIEPNKAPAYPGAGYEKASEAEASEAPAA